MALHRAVYIICHVPLCQCQRAFAPFINSIDYKDDKFSSRNNDKGKVLNSSIFLVSRGLPKLSSVTPGRVWGDWLAYLLVIEENLEVQRNF